MHVPYCMVGINVKMSVETGSENNLEDTEKSVKSQRILLVWSCRNPDMENSQQRGIGVGIFYYYSIGLCWSHSEVVRRTWPPLSHLTCSMLV